MKLQVIEQAFHLPGTFYLPTEDEIEKYGTMRDEYIRKCRVEPANNRCKVALAVGSRVFGVPIPMLQAARDCGADLLYALAADEARQRQTSLTETRQKLMAFSRVVSIGRQKEPNSWKAIGRAFNRSHCTVIHATQKYGGQIAAALEMS